MIQEMFKKMAQSIIDGDSDVAVALAKESIAYTGQLAAEWRKLTLHAVQHGADVFSTKTA